MQGEVVVVVEERGRLEIAGNRWKPEVEGRWREKKNFAKWGIVWSQRANLLGLPAASEIVNCHSGCRQTSKTDIICPYYPLLLKLSSMRPLLLPSFLYPSLHFLPVHMHVYELPNLFPLSSSARSFSATFFLSPGLFFPLMKWVSLQYSLPSHCSMVRCLSIGGRECLGSFPCFTSLPV